jgi:hypothetical protein
VIKLRRMGWAGNVAQMEEMKIAYRFCSQNLKGRDLSEDLGVNGRIILKCILKRVIGCELDLSDSG